MRYLGMTPLPRDLEEGLLARPDLLDLVNSKPGPRIVSVGDHYQAVQLASARCTEAEIRRWLDGRPAVAREPRQAIDIATPVREPKGGIAPPAGARVPSPEELAARLKARKGVDDRVSAALNGAVTMEGLIKSALAAGVPGTAAEWREKLKTAKNIGLARMRLGNILRARIKRGEA